MALTGVEQTASPKALLWSVERPFAGAFAVHLTGAMLLHRTGLVTVVLPASTEHGKRAIGVLQELGRSCRFLSEIPAGDTGLPTPGLGGALVRRGANRTSERERYRQAKATKRGGTGGRESERPIVPPTRGNRPEGPRRGKEAPGHETVGGKDAGDTEP